MQRFSCPLCGTRAYFHNLTCPCGAELTFEPRSTSMTVDAPRCANRDSIGCNWTAPLDGTL